MSGPYAQSLKIVGTDDDEVIDSTLEGIAEVLGYETGLVRRMFSRGIVKKWTLDPFSLGAYAEPGKGQVRVFEYSRSLG